jgi:hypothetical protein
MNMKKTAKAMVVASLVLGLPASSIVNAASDRALFEMSARNASGSVGAGEPLVRAGHAPIDDAVARIVPVPYRIMLDESVPASMQLVWGSGDNWMEVLRRALVPVGLVAEPDWANNAIRISWRQKATPPAIAQDQPIAAAPAAPAYQDRLTPNGQAAASRAGGFVVTQQQAPQSGGFVVTRPSEVVAATSQPQHQDSREVLSARSGQPYGHDSVERFTVGATGKLPSPDVMWRLMTAAVNGGKIVLSGVSTSGNEMRRARYGKMYADRLRARLLEVGFPSDTVVLGERQSDRANKAGVRIMVSKGEV